MALSERLAIIVDVVGANRAIGDVKGLSRAIGGIEGDFKKMTVGGMSTASMLKVGIATGAAAAGTALVALAAQGVASFVELGQKTLAFQRVTGTTAEEASGLVSAMDDVGISADRGAAAMFKLARGIGTADLGKFGVTVARTATGTVDLQESLLNVADAYTGTADPAQRAQLLMTAFGRSGKDLIPILERGREGIRSLFAQAAATGQIMSQEDVNRAEDFRLAMDALSDAMGRLQRGVGGALVPVLTDLATSLADLIDKAGQLSSAVSTKVPGFVKDLAEGAADLLDKIPKLPGPIMATSAALHAIGDAAGGAGGKLSGPLAGGIGDAAAAADAAERDLKSLQDSIFGLVNAERAQEQAARGVTIASERLTEARRKVNELLRAGAVDAKAVASAQRELEVATKDVARAQRTLVEAQQDLRDLNAELAEILDAGNVNDEAKAYNRLRQAEHGVTRASEDLATAQARENDLLTSGTATNEQLRQARRDVEDATIGVSTANQDLIDSQKGYTQAAKVGTEQDPAVISLRGQIKDKTQGIADATDNVTAAQGRQLDARNKLHEAEKGDPEFAGNLATARRGVRDAERELSGARYTLAERTWAVVEATQKEKEAFGLAAGEADRLRTKLEELKRAHPELAPLLAPALANLANMIGAGLAIGLGPVGGPIGAGRGGPPLKAFQHGGVVPGSGPRLAVVHGGERIIPGGGGGATINITVNGAFDPRAVASQIRDMLVALQRRSGSLGIEAA